MNWVAGMIVDLLLSALFLSVVLVLLLKLVLEQKTLFSSVYFTPHALKIWLYPYLAWLCFPQKCLSLLCETHTLYYFNLCSHSSLERKYWKTQTLFDTWGGCISSKTHQIHSGVQEAAPSKIWRLPITVDTEQYLPRHPWHLQTQYYQFVDITESAKHKHN